MTDIKKVIKGLKKCSIDDVDCKHCPYNGEGTQKYGCETVMQRDALKLLKEQNKKPVADEVTKAFINALKQQLSIQQPVIEMLIIPEFAEKLIKDVSMIYDIQ